MTITVKPLIGKTMHASSILVLSQDAGKGLKRGYAEVVVVDASNQPVPGAAVEGTFTEGISETLTESTGSDGKAIFRTTSTVPGRAPRLRFDVNHVTLADWDYDSAANVESWDENY